MKEARLCSCLVNGMEESHGSEVANKGFVAVKGKVHPCTGTEALYRPYGT